MANLRGNSGAMVAQALFTVLLQGAVGCYLAFRGEKLLTMCAQSFQLGQGGPHTAADG